eukprot:5507949-Amphidinium_carterae.1
MASKLIAHLASKLVSASKNTSSRRLYLSSKFQDPQIPGFNPNAAAKLLEALPSSRSRHLAARLEVLTT